MQFSENTEFAESASANWHTRDRFPALRKHLGKKEEYTNGNERSYCRYAYKNP